LKAKANEQQPGEVTKGQGGTMRGGGFGQQIADKKKTYPRDGSGKGDNKKRRKTLPPEKKNGVDIKESQEGGGCKRLGKPLLFGEFSRHGGKEEERWNLMKGNKALSCKDTCTLFAREPSEALGRGELKN